MQVKKQSKNSNNVSRSISQHLLTEQDMKKMFPFTQNIHNRYLEQNRMDDIRDSLSNQQQQSISIHINDLVTKDKIKPRLLQPINVQEDGTNRSPSKIRQLLYHDSQNINLHNLNQRREMVQLAQWMDLMIDQVKKLNISNFSEYYDKLEVVYQGSVIELQRQISSVGFEFGQFLKKLWNSFTEEIQKIILGLNQRNQEIEQKGLEEINQLHSYYQDAIAKQAQQMQLMKDEVQNVQTAIAIMKKENIYLRKKDRRREEQLQDLIQENQDLKLIVIQYKAIEKFHQQAESAEQMDQMLQQKDMFEFFHQKFEINLKEIENQYKILTLQDQYFDSQMQLILQDSSVDTNDLIKIRDQSEDTSEYFMFATSSTQTPKLAKKVNQDIQVSPNLSDVEIQVNSTQVRKERIPRNQEEQKLFRRAKFPLLDTVREYSQFYFPEQELNSNDPQFMIIIKEQIESLQDQVDDLIQLTNLRGDNSSEDMETLKEYINQNYCNFIKYFQQFWKVLQTQIAVVIDSKIETEEMDLELKEIQSKFNENVVLFKKYHLKQKEKEILSKFYENSLIKVIRYAPQFLLNSIKEQANQYGVLENVEFKELKRRQGTQLESRTSIKDLDSSPLRSSTKLSTIIKPIMKIQKIPSQIEISSKEEDDYQQSESENENSDQESDVSFSQIKLDLKGSKPKLTIEKKLRIGRCPVKSAQYCTQILKQMISKFHAHARTGLYQLSTILQSYQELILKIPNTTENTPLHVHLYENIVAHYGQSQLSDLNKYKRTIRSFIYFESKSSTCQLVVKFLKAEYDIQDLNLYLQIIQRIQEYPYIQYTKIMETLQKWFLENSYQQEEIQNIIFELSGSEIGYMQSAQGPSDYDLFMDTFLTIYQKYKNRTSKKYQFIYEAVDVYNKGYIDFKQWNLLYEILCCVNYSFSLRLFCQEADYSDENGKMMSKQRFSLICDELKLFQIEEQNKLLDNQIYSVILNNVVNNWSQEKMMMKMSFIKSNRYDRFMKALFTTIDQYVADKQKSNVEQETICFIYKLLSKIWKPYYLEAQLTIGLPLELLLINQTFRRIEFKQLNKD